MTSRTLFPGLSRRDVAGLGSSLTLSLLAVALFSVTSCTKQERPEAADNVLARVGERVITVEEFVGRAKYASLETGDRQETTAEAKRHYLDRLIDERLLAIAARARGLDSLANLGATLEEVRDQAMLRELYLQEVRGRVVVPEKEVEVALRRCSEELEVAYFRAATEEEAAWVRQQLLKGRGFAEVAAERYGKAFREEQFRRTLRWGDSDPLLEDAAFSLEVGEVSQPVPVEGAFYVLKLLGRRKVEMPPSDELRERVKARLTEHRERRLAREFLRRTLTAHPVSLNAEVFARLVGAISSRFEPDSYPLELDPAWFDSVAVDLPLSDSVLFRVGERSWKVRDAFRRLARAAHAVQVDSAGALPRIFNRLILQLAQDEALLQEARRLGLENHPRVLRDMAVWEDYLLAQILARRLGRQETETLLDSLRQAIPVVILETKLASLDLGETGTAAPSGWATGAIAFPPWPSD